MKHICCIYCEGTDSKVAVIGKDKTGTHVIRVASLSMSKSLSSQTKHDVFSELESVSESSGELSFDSLDEVSSAPVTSQDTSDVAMLQSALYGLNVPSMQFIPIVTEPTSNFHIYEGPKEDNKKKFVSSVISDIQSTKGITVAQDHIDLFDLNENQTLGVFLEGEIPCVNLVNLLANYNKRRYLKIPTLKNAELALAYYVSKTNKFFPEDNTLIVYIGKESSKLIFLEGQKLKHIGTTLDIGTRNLHTYDVYFSKILLEMENGGVPKLDNIILCGEDRSENLILSFFGTFPEANVTEMKFDALNSSEINEDEIKNLALFAVPISIGVEYFDELDKVYSGVNFLPRYIQENQKYLQFGWHSYVLLVLAFFVTLFFTLQIMGSYRKISELDFEIERLNARQAQNQAIVEEITPLDNRINNFDATQSILDSAAIGSSVWNTTLTNISDFMERRRNFWISKLEMPNASDIVLSGFSLSRSVLTEFVDSSKTALLKNINYEPLRDKSAFSYKMFLKLNSHN